VNARLIIMNRGTRMTVTAFIRKFRNYGFIN